MAQLRFMLDNGWIKEPEARAVRALRDAILELPYDRIISQEIYEDFRHGAFGGPFQLPPPESYGLVPDIKGKGRAL